MKEKNAGYAKPTKECAPFYKWDYNYMQCTIDSIGCDVKKYKYLDREGNCRECKKTDNKE